MSLVEFARSELERAGLFDHSVYGRMLGNACLELIELFEAQNHSGASAQIMIQTMPLLMGRQPLTPPMGGRTPA